MAIPSDLTFSPDDKLIAYLFSPERSLTRQLFAYDLQSGQHGLLIAPPEGGTTEERLSLEETLRRERMRQLELGVTQYAWGGQGDRILIPSQGDLYVCEGLRPEARQPLRRLITHQGQPVLEARFSPDGNWVAYVQDAELYVVPFMGGEPRQLTEGARGTGKTHGLAEYIAQEEMGRSTGFWWAPDNSRLAFTEVDETHIPVYRIVHQGKDATGEGAQEDHRYPFAGQANARVRLGVVSREGGVPVWMDLGKDEDIYLARVQWLPDGRLTAQVENREQTELELVVFDPLTGQRKTLLREINDVWINLHDLFRPLEQAHEGKNGWFIWASERSGFRHLYLYDGEGNLVRPLTAGAWMLDDISGIDEANEKVYFTGTDQGPTECHLYMIPFAGGKPQRITQEPGTHAVVIDHATQRFIDTYQGLDQPPVVSLRSLDDGSELAVIYDERDPRIDELDLQPPELVSLPNRAGVKLYGILYRPEAKFGSGPYPTIVMVYGGPHAQMVTNSWTVTARMRLQYLRSLGFLVFVLDNQGSSRRGLAFEAVIKHELGHVEVDDQVDGVRWLVTKGLADPERVGIIGWSYGGYMAVMCLARAPETFKAAVAGAPVTHYDGYDTHYTEHYMGTPQTNPKGYRESSVMAHVPNIKGKLMLVHGLIDENVHFRHTARLVNALIAARKTYDLLLFPDERHMPRKLADRVYMEERIRDFFLENLG